MTFPEGNRPCVSDAQRSIRSGTMLDDRDRAMQAGEIAAQLPRGGHIG